MCFFGENAPPRAEPGRFKLCSLGETRNIQAIMEAREPAGALTEAGVPPAPGEPRASPVLVPIRALGPGQRERINQHLRALDEHDRYLRFGYMANDEQITRYTDGLNFERDEIFGIYNRKLALIAMAHLAFATTDACRSCAEFGVSVLKKARGRGYGSRLFDRAVMHARNEGVELMFIHALSENTTMLRIAQNAGATVEREGSESQAHLRLPPATLDSRMSEIVEAQFAELDFKLKTQAKHFRDLLASLQTLRAGWAPGQGKPGR